jgi:membrane-associated phospholipid phosphatase
VLAGAFALGRLRLRGGWDVAEAVARARASIDPRVLFRRRALRIAAVSLGVVVADTVLFPEHNVADLTALMAMTVYVAHTATPGRSARAVGEAAFAALMFMGICYCFTILKALSFVGREPVDPHIVGIEHGLFGVVPHRALAGWSATRPWIIRACDWAYFKFFEHMAVTTALLLGMRRSRERLEYLGALAICYLIGGPLYHVWPGLGPVYFEPQVFAHLDGLHGLMSNDVRAWLFANTHAVIVGRARRVETWGYIACMPSLHMAQELVMLWYARRSRIALLLSLAFTSLTALSVVVLGWHYPLDVVAGAVVAAIAIAAARWQRDVLLPAIVMPPADEELPARPTGEMRAMVAALRRRRAQTG